MSQSLIIQGINFSGFRCRCQVQVESPEALIICPNGTILFGICDLEFVISPEGGIGASKEGSWEAEKLGTWEVGELFFDAGVIFFVEVGKRWKMGKRGKLGR